MGRDNLGAARIAPQLIFAVVRTEVPPALIATCNESPTLISMSTKHLVTPAKLASNQLIWLPDLRAEPGALFFHQMIGVLHNRGSQCFALNLAA
jgi:hypothetical protein